MASVLFCHIALVLLVEAVVLVGGVGVPSPKPWPKQFHSQMTQNFSGKLSVIDLWYDWPNGRNMNIIQAQLGILLYDLEWTNGTSFYYDADAKSCSSITFPVGILPPDWLVDDSHYLGVREMDGFQCNVWEKADFITYYEDVETRRPVHWLFYTGMSEHIITFEEGRVMSDEAWQTPSYCFVDADKTQDGRIATPKQSVLDKHSSLEQLLPWTRPRATIPR